MTETLRQIADLTGHICAYIRLSFGVIPLMTPRRVLTMSHAVGAVILDHVGRLHDVRELRNEDGHLRIPARDGSQPPTVRVRKLVTLDHNDEVTISILPDGPSISIVVSDLEPGAAPRDRHQAAARPDPQLLRGGPAPGQGDRARSPCPRRPADHHPHRGSSHQSSPGSASRYWRGCLEGFPRTVARRSHGATVPVCWNSRSSNGARMPTRAQGNSGRSGIDGRFPRPSICWMSITHVRSWCYKCCNCCNNCCNRRRWRALSLSASCCGISRARESLVFQEEESRSGDSS